MIFFNISQFLSLKNAALMRIRDFYLFIYFPHCIINNLFHNRDLWLHVCIFWAAYSTNVLLLLFLSGVYCTEWRAGQRVERGGRGETESSGKERSHSRRGDAYLERGLLYCFRETCWRCCSAGDTWHVIACKISYLILLLLL